MNTLDHALNAAIDARVDARIRKILTLGLSHAEPAAAPKVDGKRGPGRPPKAAAKAAPAPIATLTTADSKTSRIKPRAAKAPATMAPAAAKLRRENAVNGHAAALA